MSELQLLAGGGIAGPLKELVPQFEAATGHRLAIRFGTTPELIKLATTGGPFDMAVVPRDVFRDEAARAKVAAGPTTDVARVGLGIAVPAGRPKPDIATAPVLRAALVQAKSIATIPASAGGALVAQLFERLGLAEAVKGKIRAL